MRYRWWLYGVLGVLLIVYSVTVLGYTTWALPVGLVGTALMVYAVVRLLDLAERPEDPADGEW